MEIQVTVDGDPQALGVLYTQWLAKDPQVRRSGRLELRYAELKPGEMGGALETVALIVGMGGTLTASVTSVLGVVAAWRGTRRDEVRTEVAVVRPDGVRIEITGATPEAVAEQVRALGVG